MKRYAQKLGLAILSILFTFLVIEIVARRMRDVPLTYLPNFVETRISLFRSVFPTQYDSHLGWIPKPGSYGTDNYWGRSLTILPEGIRSNGNMPEKRGAFTILAVGDSFTYGSQVGDDETWPAVLERMSGARVINAGVFAYGLDQSVLRAERLFETFHPDLIIVSFIPDNVNRTERSVRTGAAKPFFDVVDGRLELRNIPVPMRQSTAIRLGVLRRTLGYSYFCDALMRKLGKDGFWYMGDWESARAHGNGCEVSALLMKRLAAWSVERSVKILILAEHTEEVASYYPPETKVVLNSAIESGLPVLDLSPDLIQLSGKDPAGFASLFRGHMTAAGNAFVAERVWRALVSNHYLEASPVNQ